MRASSAKRIVLIARDDASAGEVHAFQRHAEMIGRHRGHAAPDRLGRVARRHTVEVGTGRGGGRRGVRHLVRRGRRNRDVAKPHAEHLGHHLGDLDEQALPHLGAAVVQMDGTVGIDVNQRAALVVLDLVERDAELDRGIGEPLAQHRVGGIEGIDRAAALGIVGRGEGMRSVIAGTRKCSTGWP